MIYLNLKEKPKTAIRWFIDQHGFIDYEIVRV